MESKASSLSSEPSGLPDPTHTNVQKPNLFSRLVFWFVNGTIKHARRNDEINVEDIPVHVPDLRTSELCHEFETAWERVQRTHKKPHLALALASGRWPALILTGLGYLAAQGCSLAGPLLLGQIVSGLSCRQVAAPDSNCDSQATLYGYAVGLFVAPLVQAFVENNNTYVLNLLGVRFRNALMGSIYRKCLALDNAAVASESTGKIVTLMSNDAQKVQEVMMSIHTVWGAPIFIFVVMILLYMEIQWACFVGLAVMFLLGPMTGYVGKNLGLLRRQIVQWVDKRTSTMSEVVNGIRVIKFYAWEAPFKRQVLAFRAEEAKILRTIAKLQGAFGLTLFAGPVVVGVCSFAAYAAAGNELTTAKAYTSLALFTLLRFPMGFLPAFILAAVNANVALKRVAAFLSKGEVSLGDDPAFFTEGVEPGLVRIEDASFKWDTSDEGCMTLRVLLRRSDIDVSIKPGSLTMVVGAVGSGKSSFLATMLRQISRVRGTVSVGGSIAYVPQTAWIMNETIRENILLGDKLDDKRYEIALSAAQLGSDLDLLDGGDLTEIGERGVTLSGGQKQRVSIARAVYAGADVVLLDDPLSAVDAHVGRNLMDQCILGALRGRTVVLVTNALHFLHHADQVIWIKDGTIRRAGSYDEVQADASFAELVGRNVVQESAGEEDSSKDEADSNAKKTRGPLNIKSTTLAKGLTGNEDRMSGALGWRNVAMYVAAAGGTLWLISVIFSYAAEQTAKIFTDAWLGFWTTDRFDQSLGFYLGMYALLAIVFGAVTYARSVNFVFGTVRAALHLHNRLLDRVVRLPVSFFDTNPSGRIINRFSRDTDIMDSVLPTSLIQLAACVSSYIGILVVISLATPWFIVMLPPITVVYYFLQRYYIPAARDLQRLEAVTRSPIYTGFSEAVNGITTIRAYGKQRHFVGLEDALIFRNGLVFATQRAGAGWLSIRLDMIGLTVLTAAGLLAVQGSIDANLAGLSLTYALDLTRFLKFGTQMASKTESDFNSVERIGQYLNEDEEAAVTLDSDPSHEEWPSKGAISVEHAVMRYRPELPVVLNDVSFKVAAGSSVGIVGRTGSGKSSLFLLFFRMIEMEAGRIVIDGIDISSLGLETLRRGLSMIPQDPFMFSGTVRRNLDPFEQYSDGAVWTALANVGLKSTIAELDMQLDAKVTDNGGNFSQGQRQLFCLARALLRGAKILMMDEATASVDMDTDALIQRTVRENFSSCTVLTIAHRLNTIMDSDAVLVMDAGKAAEYAPPHELLQDRDSLFSALVWNTGAQSASMLHRIASESYLQKQASTNGAALRVTQSDISKLRPRAGADSHALSPAQGAREATIGTGSPHDVGAPPHDEASTSSVTSPPPISGLVEGDVVLPLAPIGKFAREIETHEARPSDAQKDEASDSSSAR